MTEVLGTISGVSGERHMKSSQSTSLALATYSCDDYTCENDREMVGPKNLDGAIKCAYDSAGCVMDGENSRRIMTIYGTKRGTLIIRAITFKNGNAAQGVGGGINIAANPYLEWQSVVELVLCLFTACKAQKVDLFSGGGAIGFHGANTRVSLFATRFTGNTAASGDGNDIYRSDDKSTMIIDNTCPPPYNDNTLTQGET